MSGEPQKNDHVPIRENGQLPPPIVRKPIYECAKAVHVEGFIPHARVTVYANGVEVIGKDKPYTSQAEIKLTRALKNKELVTATQEAFGLTSVQTYVPVTVEAQPAKLGKPEVGPVLYACGQVVPVGALTPSTHVEVYSAATNPVAIVPANLIGTAENTGTWTPVATQPLKKGWYVAARQISCSETDHKLESKPSASLKVPPEPHPVPPPVMDKQKQIPGNDVANLDNLLVGAAVVVFDETANKKVGEGLANSASNWAPINPNFDGNHKYHATQTLCTTSKPSSTIQPTGVVSAPTLYSPVCPDAKAVTVSGCDNNAVVLLYKSGVALPSFGGATNDESTLPIGPILFPLKVGDELYVRQFVGNSLGAPSNKVKVTDCRNVVTQHNNMRRTGAYLHETALTPATVASPNFHRLFERNVNGSPFAQILYVRSVGNTRVGTKNLFFVATSTNDIYAFDADDTNADPATPPIWQTHLGFARLLNQSEICRETIGSVGVTSTPVIDCDTQTMYVVAEHWHSDVPTAAGKANMDGRHFLHALKLHDGTDRVAAVEIKGTDPRSKLAFDPTVQRNRPGLLLLNGVVYIAFATFSCDGGDYHGWVFGYDAKNLSPKGIFCTSKSGDTGSGIWQSGNGLVGSDDGFIYFETGNDKGERGNTNPTYGDSFIRLRVMAKSPWLEEAGQFQPSNFRRLRDGDYTTDPSKADDIHYRKSSLVQIDDGSFANGTPTQDHWGDTDLGSGGPVLLPGGRLVGGGKQGRYFVLDSHSMQLTQDKISPDPARIGQGFQAFQNTHRDVVGDKSQNYLVYAATETYGPNIHGGPCFWQGQGLLYQMAEKDYLKSFSYDVLSRKLQQEPFKTADVRPPYGMPGGHTSISANDDKDGVVWTLFPQGDGQWDPQQGTLIAFHGMTLKELWRDSGQDPGNSEWFAKFNPPTIADGKVFRPCFAQYKLKVDGQGKDTGDAPTQLKSGKIVVYGLMKSGMKQKAHKSIDGHAAIHHIWERHGGSGLLSAQSGDATPLGDARQGLRQDFVGHFNAGKRRVSTKIVPPDATCHRPARSTVAVTSSLFWSPRTGAHLVTGEIREEYLRLGGPAGDLGYPISDEADLERSAARISVFENGEIVWTQEGGCVVRRT
jgi:hypothetical protein